uniref:Integrin_alpha2 domain-containing protein n=1 Tax=Syphacia muris TaxID=451379 RepID=A0A0N5AA07_9BILA
MEKQLLLSVDSESWVVSQMQLGRFNIRRSPIALNARVDSLSRCTVRTPITIYFTIQNFCNEAIDLSVKLEMADMFMFAGAKQFVATGTSY